MSFLFLSLVLVVCAYTDARYRKIYNVVTYTAALFALLVTCAINLWGIKNSTDILAAGIPNDWLATVGLTGSLGGGVVCFLLMIFVYSAGGAGAGDVKLATVLGLFLGIPCALVILMLAFVLAAGYYLPIRIWQQGIANAFRELFGNSSEQDCSANSVPLGVFYAVSFVSMVLLRSFS